MKPWVTCQFAAVDLLENLGLVSQLHQGFHDGGHCQNSSQRNNGLSVLEFEGMEECVGLDITETGFVLTKLK